MHTLSPLPFIFSLLTYGLICLLSVSCGMTLLSSFRLSLPVSVQLGISPVVTLAIWSLAISFDQLLGHTVRDISLALWLATIVVCVVRPIGRYLDLRNSWRAWVIVPAAPVVALFPAFWNGITNYQATYSPDAWNYVAVGQYLWAHPKAVVSGSLPPFYQYVQRYVLERSTGSSLLDFTSFLLGPGDPQLAYNLLVIFALFATGAAALAAARVLRLTTVGQVLFVSLVVFSGWTLNVVIAGNLDQLLALPYLLAAVCICLSLDGPRPGGAALLGLLLAGVVITYIEGAPFVVGTIAVIVVYRWAGRRAPLQRWLRFFLVAGASGIVLLLPFWHDLSAFFQRQMNWSFQRQVRPNEYMFQEMLVPAKYFVTIWGFGDEWNGATPSEAHILAGVMLTILFLYGLFLASRCKHWDLAGLVCLYGAVVAYFVFHAHYPYAGYKVLTYTWWLISLCLVFAIEGLAGKAAGVWRWPVLAACLAPCVFLFGPARSVHAQPTIPASSYSSMSMQPFRSLEDITDVTGGAPVCVMVDDWLANLWAFYYLRDRPTWLGVYRMYVATEAWRMASSRQADLADIHLILTDDQPNSFSENSADWEEVSHRPPYRLFRARSSNWATLTGINNDNGLERVGANPFMWLGHGTTVLGVIANTAGRAFLEGSVTLGPSVPEKTTRDVLVEGEDSYRQVVTVGEGPLSIQVPLEKGRNTVKLTPLDVPTRTLATDSRPLVLGVSGLRVETAIHGERELAFEVQNPNGLDLVGGSPWYWLGTGPTVIRFAADRAGTVELRGRFTPGPSVTGGGAARKLRVATEGYEHDIVLEKPDSVIRVPARVGANSVSLLALDKPNIKKLPNGDVRLLTIGLSGVKVVQLGSEDPGAGCVPAEGGNTQTVTPSRHTPARR